MALRRTHSVYNYDAISLKLKWLKLIFTSGNENPRYLYVPFLIITECLLDRPAPDLFRRVNYFRASLLLP